MKKALFDTPLGAMVAVADDHALHFLHFEESCTPKRLPECTRGITAPLALLKEELDAYFAGALRVFTTPLAPKGTPFQQKVWAALQKVPYGKSTSYKEVAQHLGNPKGCRAVAGGCARNPFVLLVPCHRIIAHDGGLGGYDGFLQRKQWLLAHEKSATINERPL